MIEFLEVYGDPRTRGQQHGEALRAQVQELAAIRRELLYKRSPIKDPARLSKLAQGQWQTTAEMFPAMIDELEGIGQGALVSREDLVILNNYTDFRDIGPGVEGCTALYVHHEFGAFLGQTWDMHASAERFVTGLVVDDSIVLTVAGCVGMMGMNRRGLGVAVNNLTSNDAQVGVMWPALVRGMLQQDSLDGMSSLLQISPLCSGHNYLLGDSHRYENWETSGRQKKRTVATADVTMATPPDEIMHTVFFHTNHYLDPEMRACEGIIPGQSTTYDRYRHISYLVGDHDLTIGPKQITAWLSDHEGYPRSVCSHMGTDDPDASKTCGGVVCSLHEGIVTAWKGCLHEAGNGVVSMSFKSFAPA